MVFPRENKEILKNRKIMSSHWLFRFKFIVASLFRDCLITERQNRWRAQNLATRVKKIAQSFVDKIARSAIGKTHPGTRPGNPKRKKEANTRNNVTRIFQNTKIELVTRLSPENWHFPIVFSKVTSCFILDRYQPHLPLPILFLFSYFHFWLWLSPALFFLFFLFAPVSPYSQIPKNLLNQTATPINIILLPSISKHFSFTVDS